MMGLAIEIVSLALGRSPLFLRIPLWISTLAWYYGAWLLYQYPTPENLFEVALWMVGNVVLTFLAFGVAKFQQTRPDLAEHDEICARMEEFNQAYAQAKRDGLHGEAARADWERKQFMDTVVEDDNGRLSYKKAA